MFKNTFSNTKFSLKSKRGPYSSKHFTKTLICLIKWSSTPQPQDVSQQTEKRLIIEYMKQWLASKNFGGIDLNLRTQTLFTFNSSRNSLENHNPFKSAGITATKWSHDMKQKHLLRSKKNTKMNRINGTGAICSKIKRSCRFPLKLGHISLFFKNEDFLSSSGRSRKSNFTNDSFTLRFLLKI